MANKNYFEFIDIPNGSGDPDRWHARDAEAHVYASSSEIDAMFSGDSMPGNTSQFSVATRSEILAMMQEVDDGGSNS